MIYVKLSDYLHFIFSG